MRWLHITDVHCGRADNAQQQSAVAALVRDVLDHLPWPTVDAVFVSGDVSYSGDAAEFEAFRRQILDPLRAHAAFRDSRYFVVPGNHDVDCSLVFPATWENIGDKRRRTFFSEGPEGVATRAPRAPGFKQFEAFASTHAATHCAPSSCVSSFEEVVCADKRFGVLLTNTAFFSDKERDVPDREKVPATTASMRAFVERMKGCEWTLVLAHHPVAWFLHKDREPLKSFLLDNRAVYLHGHTHEAAATFGPRGVITIGFGAAYPGPLDGNSEPEYHNAYAFCEWHQGVHVALRHWDSTNGRWHPWLDLPMEFANPSTRLAHGTHFPLGAELDKRNRLEADWAPREHPSPQSLMLLGDLKAADWRQLIAKYRITAAADIRPDELVEERRERAANVTFSYETANGRAVVHCMSGTGHVMPSSVVEDANTRIDLEGLASYTIVTLGTLSDDGRTQYLRLKARKPLEIVAQLELAERLFGSQVAAARSHVGSLDRATAAVELVLMGSRVFTRVEDLRARAWFYVIDDAGVILPESDAVVVEIRKTRAALAATPYGRVAGGGQRVADPEVLPFDRAAFLKAYFLEFNALKYAALATVGLRVGGLTLQDVYVAASADVERGGVSDAAVARAIEESLRGLSVDPDLRTHMEAQLRRTLRIGPTLETGAARRLYQKHGCVLVLGDPGSGKTCFVKHEILAYCTPPEVERDWYEKHTPVYVGLSEAAKLLGEGDESPDIVALACRLISRQGFVLTSLQLTELLHDGGVAFFFDGLDEVVSVAKRAAITKSISELIDRWRPRGNRFVLTSRPAAVQVVEIPETLVVMNLKGLTEPEMRTLARNVLAARVSDGGTTVRLRGDERASRDDEDLIERLVQDCRDVPGIAQLAGNPLLLTLLILIYANSGPPAAKRHRIYQQAVSTLVSVRSRLAGQVRFSEADLRRRLGALALAVMRDAVGVVPSWDQVVRTVVRVITAERGSAPSHEEVERFIQDVAESTGVLVIHRQPGQGDGAAVSFMHHSFLEYYAAVGLLQEPEWMAQIADLARLPAWREIVTLVSGILGDQGDTTPLVAALLDAQSPSERITLEMLSFAFDCALECDVPPEPAVQRLMGEFRTAVGRGLSQDRDLCRSLCEQVAKTFERSRSSLIVREVVRELDAHDPDVAACGLTLAASVYADDDPPAEVLSKFEAACGRGEAAVMAAACWSLGRSRTLRTEPAVPVIRRSLERGADLMFGAAEAVKEAPALAPAVWGQLIAGLREAKPYVAIACANAVLEAGFRLDPDDIARRSQVLLALQVLHRYGVADSVSMLGLACSRAQIEPLLSSPARAERLFALHLLPWVRNEERFVHDRLLEVLWGSKQGEHDLVVAALGSLRLSENVHRILLVAEHAIVCSLLDSTTRDVRMSAARTVAALGDDDRGAEPLLKYFREHQTEEEYHLGLKLLAHLSMSNAAVRSAMEGHVSERLRVKSAMTKERKRDLIAMFEALAAVDWSLSAPTTKALLRLVHDYRVDADVRAAALAAFSHVVAPDQDAVRQLAALVRQPPIGLGGDVFRAARSFARRTRRKWSYIREANEALPDLLAAVQASVVAMEGSAMPVSGREYVHPRAALFEINRILNAHIELAGLNGGRERSSPAGAVAGTAPGS